MLLRVPILTAICKHVKHNAACSYPIKQIVVGCVQRLASLVERNLWRLVKRGLHVPFFPAARSWQWLDATFMTLTSCQLCRGLCAPRQTVSRYKRA